MPEQTQREMEERTNWGDMLSTPRAPATGNRTRGQAVGSTSCVEASSHSKRRSRSGSSPASPSRSSRSSASGTSIKQRNALPEGIVSGNGRIEGKLVDVSAKEPLRVKEVLVDEGALVKPGQVLVRLDTVTLEAELAEAKAAVAGRRGEAGRRQGHHRQAARARSSSPRSRRRARSGWSAQGAGSQRELDVRKTKVETTKAALGGGAGDAADGHPERRGRAQANAATIQTRIDDATLKSPVTGRVLYRLAGAGRGPRAGGKALTLVNLEDIYMEIFLPSEQAAAVKVGAEGRITVDYDPKRAVAGYVSFVSPEAQFTPKQVETKSEREKLMFRVKIQLPKELVGQYVEQIKTGVRGVGYVKVKDSAVWPARLQNLRDARPAVGSLAR